MPVSEAQKKATAKYEQQNYDKVLLRLEKGRKGEIKAAAEKQEQSLNGFIVSAIDEKINRSTPTTADITKYTEEE